MSLTDFQPGSITLHGGGKLAYTKRPGKHQTIILLHGFSGDHTGLLELAAYLPKQYEIIVPDLPGFGASDDPPPTHQQSVLPYSQCLTDIITKVASTNRIVLAGHSFGCMVAFAYAAQHPSAIASLVGINPIATRKVLPRLLGTVGTAAFRHFGFERSRRLLAWPPLVDFETYYLLWRLPKARYDIVRQHRRHEAAVLRGSTFTMISAADSFRRHADALRVTCPALFIVAADDNVAGKTDSNWFIARIPHASVQYCTGGHLAPVVLPEALATLINGSNILQFNDNRV